MATKKQKILVVEDELTLQKSLLEFLKKEKFEAVGASDGEQGLALAKSMLPDLILLDIILPKKDGYEVLAQLKQDEATKHIPVILLTNLESPENINRAFEKGAHMYLVKSDYRLEEIVEKAREALKA